MSELMNRISKDNLRSSMNLIFSMMKFMAMILDLLQDSKVARETLAITAQGLSEQADILLRDVGEYVSALSEGRRVSAPNHRNEEAGDG